MGQLSRDSFPHRCTGKMSAGLMRSSAQMAQKHRSDMANNFKAQLNKWATAQHHQGFASNFTLTFDTCSPQEYRAELIYCRTGQRTHGGTTRGKRDTEEDACQRMLALLGVKYERGKTRKTRKTRKTHKDCASSPKVHTHQPPFASASGVWVAATEFNARKSFGCFRCTECNNAWGSAHAYPKFRQGCRACNVETKPCCLWVNDDGNDNDRDIDRDEAKGHHDSQRCEACRLGVCDLVSPGY